MRGGGQARNISEHLPPNSRHDRQMNRRFDPDVNMLQGSKSEVE